VVILGLALAGCGTEPTPEPGVETATTVQGLDEATGKGACNNGELLCCNTAASASDPTIQLLLGLLGIVVAPNGLVGVTCTPILTTPESCGQIPLCCTNNAFNGLIALGCSQP
jgi:hypothetical protein